MTPSREDVLSPFTCWAFQQLEECREKNIPETLQKVPALYPCVSRTQPEVTSPELEHQGTLHRTADASVTQLKRRGTRISNPKV